MPKKKQFLQQAAGSKQKANPAGKKKQPPEPETEDDFLDAADEHEKAAGKWRAGDAAKSARFFQRAIDAYAAGLAKFPKSFDLAYNKALLEYEITQVARIAREFKHSRIDMLQEALSSHEYTLELNPSNIDVRFNTAQVMSSLAELLEEANEGEGVSLYVRGIMLMTKVFADQESEYNALQEALKFANSPSEQETQAAAASSTQSGSPQDSASPQNEYATVEETVTERAILDTFFSCSRMMAELLLILPTDRFDEGLERVAGRLMETYEHSLLEGYFEKLSRTRPEAAPRSLSLPIGAAPQKPEAPPLSPWEEAKREYYLEKAIFASAYKEVHLRLGVMGLTPQEWYLSIIRDFGEIYRFPSFKENSQTLTPPTADGVCAYAEALIDLVDAITPPAESRRANEESYIYECNNKSFEGISKTDIFVKSGLTLPLDPTAAQNAHCMLNLPLHDLYMDALNRASYLLTQVAPTLAESDKLPSILTTAGDVQWRYRNAFLAFLGCAPKFDLVSAYCHEMRADKYWVAAEQKTAALRAASKDVDRGLGEAKAKALIGRFARGGPCNALMRDDEMLASAKASLRNTLVGMVKDGLIAHKVLEMADAVGWF